MKKIASAIGTFFGWLLIGLLLLVLSPLLIGAVVFFGSMAGYRLLWSRLRRDPKKMPLTIDRVIDENWERTSKKEDFISSFETLSDSIASATNAKQSKIVYEGFEVFEKLTIGEWKTLRINRILQTKQAKIRLTFTFGVYKYEDGQVEVGMENDDDQCGTLFPPLAIEIVTPKSRREHHLQTYSFEGIWAAIGILRGDAKFVGEQEQLWVYVPEHKLWLVKYKAQSSDYGLRRQFKGALARQYFFDRQL